MIALWVILVPLLTAALGVALLRRGRALLWLCPVAALPALGVALFADGERSDAFGWVLLESHLGLIHSGPAFLFFTATVWFLGGWYAVGYVKKKESARFAMFWLLSMAGNFGLVLAGDVPSFYAFFTLMTFSAYGLVVSAGSPEAWRAGKVYIVLAVVGEAMLVGALLLAVAGADSYRWADVAAAVADASHRDLILLLGLAGFGVKAGIFPLHFWLPLAHPVAPTPASAVLSGVMIKAGLLGWMHLFPGGHDSFPGWSVFMVALGMFTAFYGVACGLFQSNLKTILAYSSVSQMGIMLVVVGAGLAAPEAWQTASVVAVVYALNHALAKTALFLGVGVCEGSAGAGAGPRRLILAGLGLPALAIAGAPWLGGAMAKNAVKLATEVQAETIPGFGLLLPFTSIATTLILGRFLLLSRREMFRSPVASAKEKGLRWPWVFSIAAAMGGIFFAMPWYGLELTAKERSWIGIWENTWPVLAGAGLLLLARVLPVWINRLRIPPGDIVVLLGGTVSRIRREFSWLVGEEAWRIDFHRLINRLGRSRQLQKLMGRGEAFFRQKETVGFFMMLFVLVLWLLLGER